MKNRVKIYSTNNIDDLLSAKNPTLSKEIEYLAPIVKNGINSYVKNIQSEMKILLLDKNTILPLVFVEKHYNDSLVSSLHSHYISYIMKEIDSKLLKWLMSLGGELLKLCKINKIIYVNNWLLSTNLYPELSNEQIKLVTGQLKKKYPGYAIAFRSINKALLGGLYSSLVDQNYKMVINRQVFIIGKEQQKNMLSRYRRKITKDGKIINDSDYKFANPSFGEEYERCADLYEQLYIKKYSKYNPHYTGEFFKLISGSKIFNLDTLGKEKRADGVSVYFNFGNQMTCPIIGYEFNVPQNACVYRMLTAKLIEHAENSGFDFNMSAGVGDFKIQRGAKSEMEYLAINYRHLPLYRKIAYKILLDTVNTIIPVLCKLELGGFVRQKV